MRRFYLFFVFLLAFSAAHNSCNARLLGITVTPESYNFANIPVGGSKTKVFDIKNSTPSTIQISNLMVICPKCDTPSRLGRKMLENRKYVRVCKSCGEMLVSTS